MNNKYIPYFQVTTAIGIILFWMAFFTIGFESPAYPPYYSTFEHSFPLPDAFLSLMLTLAYLKRNTIDWKKYTLVAAGAMVFLGLCDFSFNALNEMYQISITDTLMNVFINIWCISFGLYQLVKVKLD